MATKRLRDIDINIQVREGRLTADATVVWDVPDLPEIPPQSIPLALDPDASDTLGSIIAALDGVAEEAIAGSGRHTIEKPTRPTARTLEGR